MRQQRLDVLLHGLVVGVGVLPCCGVKSVLVSLFKERRPSNDPGLAQYILGQQAAIDVLVRCAVGGLLAGKRIGLFGDLGEGRKLVVREGPIARDVVLLLWFWISALILLVGAEINAELDARSKRAGSPMAELPPGATPPAGEKA